MDSVATSKRDRYVFFPVGNVDKMNELVRDGHLFIAIE